jgi:hypothetical protein
VGEEISCRLPRGNVEVHIAAYGMTESLHRDVQALRGNVFDVIARLREAGVFFALNHLLHFYRGQLPLTDYMRLVDAVPALEVRNGTMLRGHNELLELVVAAAGANGAARRLGAVAGSDAHTLRRIGRTWTEAPATSREEFVASLADGLGRPGGGHGTAATIAADAYGVIGRFGASLLGLRPCDHTPLHRAFCLAFFALSLPFEFLPMIIAARGKRRERLNVEQAGAVLPQWLAREPRGHELLQAIGHRA